MKNYISVKAEYGSKSSTTEINKVAKDGYEFVAFHEVDGVSYALLVKEVEEEEKEVKEETKKPKLKPFCNQCKFYRPGPRLDNLDIFGSEDRRGSCMLKYRPTESLRECWCFEDLIEELERSGEEE